MPWRLGQWHLLKESMLVRKLSSALRDSYPSPGSSASAYRYAGSIPRTRSGSTKWWAFWSDWTWCGKSFSKAMAPDSDLGESLWSSILQCSDKQWTSACLPTCLTTTQRLCLSFSALVLVAFGCFWKRLKKSMFFLHLLFCWLVFLATWLLGIW